MARAPLAAQQLASQSGARGKQAPVLSAPAASRTLKGVQASCCPRQAPCDADMSSTAGAASALRSSARRSRGDR